MASPRLIPVASSACAAHLPIRALKALLAASALAGAVSFSVSRVRRFGTIFTLEIEGSF